MARRPAFPRWARRPGPLVADAALALALAVVSLGTVEAGRPAQNSGRALPTVTLSSPPRGLQPGDAWNAVVTVRHLPSGLSKPRPGVTILNTSTGRATAYAAKPTRTPGVYRARVVFPDRGVYTYEPHGGFEQLLDTVGHPAMVRVGRAAAPGGPRLPTSTSDPFPLGQVLLTLLATLPVALRRRHPIPVLAVTLGAALAVDALYDSFTFAGGLVALYTVGAHVERSTSIQVAGATAVALGARELFVKNVGLLERGAVFALFAAAWLLGAYLGTRRAYLRGLEERAQRLEHEREESVRRAAAEEQARVARELHDIIAHNVSVMTVQAAAAGDAFDAHPGRAREALGAIESTGREALRELRRLLGGVRPANGAGDLAPQPGLSRLEALVDQVRGAGLAVHLSMPGSAEELPPSVDLSAYRIVQEALTNTLKHAQASHVSVSVRHGAGALEIEVVDDGRGPAMNGAQAGGHGIIGMRERAALFDGELRAGPAPGGGFAVHARIPLAEPS